MMIYYSCLSALNTTISVTIYFRVIPWKLADSLSDITIHVSPAKKG